MTTPLLTIKELAAQLKLSARTIYTIPFFRLRAVYPTKDSPRWRQLDVDLYLSQQTGMGRSSARAGRRSRRTPPTPPSPRHDEAQERTDDVQEQGEG